MWVQVKCEPISPVLLSYGVDHISMWVLDVEGAELEVLQVGSETEQGDKDDGMRA